MHLPDYRRPLVRSLVGRLGEPRRFIQVLLGPRQTGKTTAVRQALEDSGRAFHYAAADAPAPPTTAWVEAQWEAGRHKARAAGRAGAVLVLDEVQKASGWSEAVKRLWDEDGAAGLPLKAVLLGSAPLLVGRGLGESLAGRFEVVRVPHWSFAEAEAAFGLGLERFVYFGGYPGAAALVGDEARWRSYIRESLVETTVSRDILLQTRVDKPALLRRLLQLGCDYSGQVLSFTKMLGQLHDAGNTVTLAHYLDLLAGAGMVTGLQKYSGSRLRQRGSIPKLLALNTALMSALGDGSFSSARAAPEAWGRLVETAVGAHLVNGTAGTGAEVFYWREGNDEVDFVLKAGGRVTAIEVTGAPRKTALSGMEAFAARFRPKRKLLVGGQGVPLEEFLRTPAGEWAA